MNIKEKLKEFYTEKIYGKPWTHTVIAGVATAVLFMITGHPAVVLLAIVGYFVKEVRPEFSKIKRLQVRREIEVKSNLANLKEALKRVIKKPDFTWAVAGAVGGLAVGAILANL